MEKLHTLQTFADNHLRNPESIYHYGNPKEMVSILEDEYGTEFNLLYSAVQNVKINVSAKQIENFAGEKFEPYVLEYFHRNVDIYKGKTLTLLGLIDNIVKKQSEAVKPTLKDLDIKINKVGEISNADLLRLVPPTIYNLNALHNYVAKANNLSTYLTTNFTQDALYEDGLTDADIYPCETLQTKSLSNDCLDGNVPLSQRQAEQIRKKHHHELTK